MGLQQLYFRETPAERSCAFFPQCFFSFHSYNFGFVFRTSLGNRATHFYVCYESERVYRELELSRRGLLYAWKGAVSSSFI